MFDDLIENIEDTFEDMADGVKKMDKKKIFTIACVLVGGVALLVWFRNRNTRTEYSETVIAGSGGGAGDIAYTGSASGGAGADSGFNDLVNEFNETLSDLESEYNTELDNMSDIYNSQLSGIKSEYDSKLAETETYYSDQIAILNADAERLKAEKEQAQKSVGSYDKSINYTAEIQEVMADGVAGNSDRVSDLAISRASKITYEKEYSNYSADYDKNIDYQAAINKAKSEGASQEVIDTLTSQREAKIRGEQMTQYYGDLKKE